MNDTTTSHDTQADGPAAAVAAYRDEFQVLISATPAARLAADHAAAMDRMVVALAREAARIADPGRPWALIALGGYGAGRLLPHSDVDLLVACDSRPERLASFVSALLYPMWDAGLKIGHSVRDRKQALLAAADDPANLTAMLTGRLLAGSAEVASSVLSAVAKQAAHRPYARRGIVKTLASRVRSGSPYELWPELKEDRGGQRDLDELAWSAAALSGTAGAGFEGMVGLGYLSHEEARSLDAAQDTVTIARWVAHLVHERGDNRLDEDVTAVLVLDPNDLQRALVGTDALLEAVRRRLADSAPQGLGSRPPRRPPEPIRDAADVVSALAEGPDRLEDALAAAWAGRLDAAVPGWSDLMVLRRPALSHRLTVGAHCMTAASLVTRVCAEDPRAAPASRTGRDRIVLVVAALLHDIGKRSPGDDHALAGAPLAREAAFHLGLTGPESARVAALVRHHLLLAETAVAQDIDDEDLVLTIAARVGDADLASALYVLTQVDSLATGPDVWTPWRAALVGELTGKVERVLSGADSTEMAARAAATRGEVVELARYEPVGRSVADFARHAPLRYLAEHTAEEVVQHARLAFSLSQGGRRSSAGLEVRPASIAGAWTLTVVALDRPGLLALVAGVIALSGLDVLGVSAHTTSRGVALDSFTVTGATLADVEPSTWARLERSLDAALTGHLAVPVRLAERRGYYRGSERALPPRVRVAADGDFTTSFAVRAGDRVGLFHDLALALSDAALDIRSVTAMTSDGVARDTFRVVDAYGKPPRDPEALELTRQALLRAAEGNPSPRDEGSGEHP